MSDREVAEGIVEYLSDFTSGKGFTEVDVVCEALEKARAEGRGEAEAASKTVVSDSLRSLAEASFVEVTNGVMSRENVRLRDALANERGARQSETNRAHALTAENARLRDALEKNRDEHYRREEKALAECASLAERVVELRTALAAICNEVVQDGPWGCDENGEEDESIDEVCILCEGLPGGSLHKPTCEVPPALALIAAIQRTADTMTVARMNYLDRDEGPIE